VNQIVSTLIFCRPWSIIQKKHEKYNAKKKPQKPTSNNTSINQKKFRAFASELAKDIHIQGDLATICLFGQNDHRSSTWC
jgi:hypothetical protein